ncbi:hypothetical protein A2U01_0073589 [Trifolium medium]|uniref:Uncharacterized protein n=1 Tax=Trifolium medium TaxID=97028 RepID=A0A392SWA1_9FABA|nr:hypothetical protein [Trifolium medium]
MRISKSSDELMSMNISSGTSSQRSATRKRYSSVHPRSRNNRARDSKWTVAVSPQPLKT